ncbi:hypothetical protein TomTYG45_33410 [Sphingobium sp. TomTYG45]
MLQGKTAVVTGGAQGIGRAICELYAAQGAKVAVVDMQDGEAAAAGIREGGGEAIYVQCDVTARASVNAAAATIREKLGQIDILVNNAGNTSPAMIEKMTDDNWDKVIAVHMTGGFYWLQAAIPDMIENKWGRVIFSSSFTAQLGSIGQLSYSAAKSGILGMVRSASRELGKHNILVNAVSPRCADRNEPEGPRRPQIRRASCRYCRGQHAAAGGSGRRGGQGLSVPRVRPLILRNGAGHFR